MRPPNLFGRLSKVAKQAKTPAESECWRLRRASSNSAPELAFPVAKTEAANTGVRNPRTAEAAGAGQAGENRSVARWALRGRRGPARLRFLRVAAGELLLAPAAVTRAFLRLQSVSCKLPGNRVP
jgi:hypothetical protein